MNFDFSDDQKLLREQARRFLSERCPPKAVRAVLESEASHDRALWSAIAEMGWLGTSIPEEFGGLGLGYLELCVIAEELGRVLAPVPFASSIYLFAECLLRAGSAAQKSKLLPKVSDGSLIGCFARSEGGGALTVRSIRTSFKGGRLNGVKLAVSDGMAADHAIVLARASDEAGERGLCLVLVDLNGPGVSRRAEQSIDPSRKHARIVFENTPAEAVGQIGEGWSTTQAVLNRAAILTAFEQVGGADACLAMAKAYAMERYAFGRPIASYQAIKHKLADMYVNNELARSNSYYGAWAMATDAPELALAAAAARVSATQAFDYAAKENIQTHGGVGFTWEFDCHLYYKRARELALNLGAQRSWKDKLVSALEMSNAA
ncbi:MAG: acyl-CoA/acyl-ACP dehydrogenase [Alphaproteobacteria bacterium]|nr:acyl-CoA/acyl-ACP dehydrogenase [Alphaproteobacteria bacterium]